MESGALISMKLDVIVFREDEGYIAFCPALDLCGCGKSEAKAKESFKIVLEEHVKFTTENKTFIEDLRNHGWKIEGRKLNPPEISESLCKNSEFSHIFNNYDFNKRSIPVQMPLV
jgi:predicted RNase H-like HicB family nuclease